MKPYASGFLAIEGRHNKAKIKTLLENHGLLISTVIWSRRQLNPAAETLHDTGSWKGPYVTEIYLGHYPYIDLPRGIERFVKASEARTRAADVLVQEGYTLAPDYGSVYGGLA